MKKRLWWLLALALFAALCGAVGAVQQVDPQNNRYQIAGFAAPAKPDPSAVAAVAKVPTVSRPWMATWDLETGRVRMLYNGETPATPGNPEAQARAFLRANKALFGLGDTSDLKLAEVLTHEIGETVRFQQFYRGVRVYPGDVAVSRNRDGRIFLVSSEYRPGLSLSTKPSVSQDEARREAVAQCGGGKVLGSELVVWGLKRPFRLAWQVDVDVDAGKLMRVFLDANTGRLISKFNRVSAQAAEPLADVYLENPVATPQLTTIKLTNLDGSGTLSGKYVKVLKFTGYDNEENPLGQPDLRQGPEGFRVPPGDERFNQPSVYFHVNRMHDYFSKNFNYTKRDDPMPVYVSATRRDGKALNNAYFAPVGYGYLVFGKASDGKDYALDSDVINHEYTHSVVETLCKIGDNPIWTEARAINEALADYYACTVNGNPTLGEYASSSGRNLANRLHYPEEVPLAFRLRDGSLLYNFPEEHDTSRIWSGTLWDMRRALGAAVADKIIFNSLPLLPAAAGFSDGRVAIRTADQQLNTGAGATIAKIMENRGIAEQAQYTYADPLEFGDEKTYLVVTGFIDPEGGPIDVFGFLPVYVTGRRYLLSGIVDSGDTPVRGVRLVFFDSNNQPVEKISPRADLARVMVLLRGGQQRPVTRFEFVFSIPEGNEGKYSVGIAVSFDGQEYKLAKTLPAAIIRDSGPAPEPPNEVVSPAPLPPAPTPTPEPPPAPVPPAPVVPAAIQVQPQDAVVAVGQQQRFYATVVDASGQAIPNAAVTWSIEGPQDIGEISSNGIFVGRKAGQVAVVAKVGAVQGRANVRVTAPEAPPGVAAWKQLPGTEGQIVLGLAGAAASGLKIIYMAGPGGVFRSVNDGRFEKIAPGIDEGYFPTCVDTNPVEPRIVFVGTLNAGLYASEDAGGTWFLYSEELADPFMLFFFGGGHPPIVSVMTDAENEVVIGTVGKGTFVRLDPFSEWVDVSAGLGTATVNSFVLNKEATAMFVGTSVGAYRLRENETAWKPINNGLESPRSEADRYSMLPFVNRIALNPLRETELLAATDEDGVFFSANEGDTWVSVNSGIPTKKIYAVAFDPKVPGRMFAGTADSGVFVSTDGGKTWQAARSGLANGTITALFFDPANPSRLYAGTMGDGVWYLDLTGNIRSEPPRVTYTTPISGERDVLTTAVITATFATAMDAASINTSTFVVKDQAGQVVAGKVTYDSVHFVAAFTPSAPLAGGTTYTATITTGVRDIAGTSLQQEYSWSFTTAKEAAPPPPAAVVRGDVTGDGKVNIADATMALRMAVGIIQPTQAQLAAGDLNGDGKIAINEVLLILRAAVGLGKL